MMDYNGEFGGFLKEVCENGGMQSELMNQFGLLIVLLLFDGLLVYDDLVVLNCWLIGEECEVNFCFVIFFNLLLLYDGNYFFGVSKMVDYKICVQKLFDELDVFFIELEKFGCKVMVVVVLEYGGVLKGDRMQILGLCDIFSFFIINVLVGVKFFGMKVLYEGVLIDINQLSSYLVIFELVVCVVDGKFFIEDSVNWNKLISNLL